MKSKKPDTSLSAYKMLTHEMINSHHGKIIGALKKMGAASYEEIANYTGMDKHQIGRRLSELERMEVVYKPGSKKPTKSGRMAYCYCLIGTGAKTENEIREAKPQFPDQIKSLSKSKKEAQEFLNTLLQEKATTLPVQKSLF